MGPKSSTASQSNEYSTLLKDYDIVKQVDAEGLFFLKNIRTPGDFLLRQLTFNDKKQFERWVQIFQKRKGQLQNCKYVVPLQRIITKAEDQYCSTFYKIYSLFQFTERTLQDEINQRSLQKRKFQEKQIWSILASCIVGMSHLQKQNIKHQSLRSNTVLISSQGIIKVYDLIATGAQTNYDTLISKRSTPHIYLSPELAYCLQIEAGVPASNSYKSDIWSMGMIILEAGLLKYQDECYRDECSRVHWQTVQYNIHLFSQSYSEQLTALVEFMLSREEQNRPDWLQLQERVIKQEQTRMSQVNISKESNVSRFSQRPNPVSYNPPLRNTVNKEQSAYLVNSQTVPPYQESARVMPKSFGAPLNQSINRSPLIQSSASKASSPQVLVQFKPSIIEHSRPLRNIFPPNTYVTLTKVDQNLIIVPQDQRYSDVEETPNNKYSSTYFQSNPKKIAVQSAQAQRFYNTFTPTQQHTFTQQNTRQPQVNTYGVSVFHPPNQTHLTSQTQAFQHISLNNQQVPIISSSYQTPIVHQSPIINQNQPTLTPPPQVQPNSAVPKGQEGEYVIERYRQGSQYKGYKWQGMRHGFGVFYYQDGGMYQGEWRFNKMQGKGKLYYQSGKLAYEGDWANDQFEGIGKLYNEYPQVTNQPLNCKNLDQVDEMWTKYQGEFRGDLKNGHGILFLTNGEYYQGEFFDDYAHGQGVYMTMSGNRIVGRWDRNMYIQ